MPRPCKCRRVCGEPQADYFKPRGIKELEEVILRMDEFEAIRLADLKGMYQEDAALKMNISRQTFGNIIKSARRKVAEAIVRGKALKIEGKAVVPKRKKFICPKCNHGWSVSFETGKPAGCPKCQCRNIHRRNDICASAGVGGSGRKKCGKRRSDQ
jgi:predicted DNA-binding protein (UPF0251 family)